MDITIVTTATDQSARARPYWAVVRFPFKRGVDDPRSRSRSGEIGQGKGARVEPRARKK